MAKNKQRNREKKRPSSSVHLFIFWWNIPLRRDFWTQQCPRCGERGPTGSWYTGSWRRRSNHLMRSQLHYSPQNEQAKPCRNLTAGKHSVQNNVHKRTLNTPPLPLLPVLQEKQPWDSRVCLHEAKSNSDSCLPGSLPRASEIFWHLKIVKIKETNRS